MAATCKHGHELTPENIRREGGSLRCAVCRREQSRRCYQKNTETIKASSLAYRRKNLEDVRRRERDRARELRRSDPTIKQHERARAADKRGKAYRTKDEAAAELAARRHQRAIAREARKAERAQYQSAEKVWIARLQQERPDLYDSTINRRALVWRAQYNLDPQFRAKQIERMHTRKTRQMISDGTLDSEAICRLFSRNECPYCGKRMESRDKTLDHIIPRSAGGWHSVSNAIVCCRRCNAAKSARTPEQWLQRVSPGRRDEVSALWQHTMHVPAAQMWLAVSARP